MQPEETPRDAGETTEQVPELEDLDTFAEPDDFPDSDDDDTGDIEIVVPSQFPDESVDQPGVPEGITEISDRDTAMSEDEDSDLGPDDDFDFESDGDDEFELEADDEFELEADDEFELTGTANDIEPADDRIADGESGSDLDTDTDTDTDTENDDAATPAVDRADSAMEADIHEPVASMPDRAIDDWISNSHEDAHANWLDKAEKGTRSTVIAVVIIAILIAIVAIAFVLATNNSV